MCEPATITMVAATLISGYAAVKQGETANDIAEHNAKVENYKAQSAIQDAGIMEDRQRARVRQIRGAQLAALGASSIDPTTGNRIEGAGSNDHHGRTGRPHHSEQRFTPGVGV